MDMQGFLRGIVLEAGRVSLDFRARLSELAVSAKAESSKDLVTEADRAVERFLTDEIGKRYPEHAIWGEEHGQRAGKEYRWVIDPIDGTASFVHDQPFYAVSVGVEKAGEVVLAAVNGPVLGELYEAKLGGGARCNGRAIRVSRRARMEESMVATGFACLRANLAENNLPYFNLIAARARGIRRYGSAALDLCYVGCGRLEGFWELNLEHYDVAAGSLIVTEAGGRYSDFAGKAAGVPGRVLASNGLIHEEMMALLGRAEEADGAG